MLIVRSVQATDLDPLFELIQRSEYGLTTLKISKDELESRIEKSLFAFQQKQGKPNGQPYVFVMEDLKLGKIVGTCSIYSKVGGYEPMYSYEIKQTIHRSDELQVEKTIDVLHLRAEHDGPSAPDIEFIHADYTAALDLPEQHFDLLVSLYAGFVSAHCTQHLDIGGTLLVNSSHGDAAMASIDPRYDLTGVVRSRPGDYWVDTTGLDAYLQPKKPVTITADLLHATGRGIGYTKSPFAYLFTRIR